MRKKDKIAVECLLIISGALMGLDENLHKAAEKELNILVNYYKNTGKIRKNEYTENLKRMNYKMKFLESAKVSKSEVLNFIVGVAEVFQSECNKNKSKAWFNFIKKITEMPEYEKNMSEERTDYIIELVEFTISEMEVKDENSF